MTEAPLFPILTPPEPGSAIQRLLLGFSVNLSFVVLVLTLGPTAWQPASTHTSRQMVLVRLPDPQPVQALSAPEALAAPRRIRKGPLPAGRPEPAMPEPATPKPATPKPSAMPAPPVLATAPVPPVRAPIPAAVPALVRPQPVLGSFADATTAAKPNFARSSEVTQPEFDLARPQMATRRTDSVQVGALDLTKSQAVSRNRRQMVTNIGFEQLAKMPVKAAASPVTAEAGFDIRLSREPVPSRRRVEEGGFEPVEILKKPKPTYTEAARRLGIEGEVSLRILFGSDGKLKVLGIVQGLGYGLDE
ncbi:MAG: energy transducer TonB, partial [Acidobacteriota bacterium]